MANQWKKQKPYLRKKNKFGAHRVKTAEGDFASKREFERYELLKEWQSMGYISGLQFQVPFELIPSQRGSDGRVIERAVKYIADFVYTDCSGEKVVEDTKGFRTKEYVIKRKLMLFRHGIQITEV